MIDPIERATDELIEQGDGVQFDMHSAMVETTLRVVSNTLFSQDFGPIVHSMRDLTTRGLRRTELLARLGLLGLLPRPVYDAIATSTFSGIPLPPPLR
ncbi:hypothetical protein, partial [Streptomyces sp. DSM 41033]